MEIRFWGTRGSIAKPGPSTIRYGGNTSCVEVRSAGGTLVVIDCGTGAHGLGHALLDEFPEGPVNGHILVTHTHWDHIQGFPFFAPLFREGSRWQVYGPRGLGTSLRDTLSGQMQYAYFPVDLDQLAANVEFHSLVEGQFTIGDLRVFARYLNHPALTLGYRIEGDNAVAVYASDHEPHGRVFAHGGTPGQAGEDAAHVEFLADADLVIHDAQYRADEYADKVGWGHSTVEYAVDCAIAARVRKLALFHHDPLRDDAALDENLELARARVAAATAPLDVVIATEGATIELARSATPNTRAVDLERDALMQPDIEIKKHSIVVAGCGPASRRCIAGAARADELPVVFVDGVAQALELTRQQRPSVVFVGEPLDGGGVGELCDAVRALPARGEAPAIVVGVAESDGAAARAAGDGAGISEWLIGSVTPQYVRTRLRAWLLRRACRWQAARLPADEQQRLAELADTGLLDTPPEPRFDRHTERAAHDFGVPIALVSLVDADRQWFKSSHGIDTTETPRDRAFCAHAILGDEIMVVPDAAEDGRFADNPLVTGEPRIRFYAGVPLKGPGGHRIGTLCLIDHRPRRLADAERSKLLELAATVEEEIALGRGES